MGNRLRAQRRRQTSAPPVHDKSRGEVKAAQTAPSPAPAPILAHDFATIDIASPAQMASPSGPQVQRRTHLTIQPVEPRYERGAGLPVQRDGEDLGQRIRAAQTGGSRLQPAVRQRLEHGLGADLSSVRVHTDGQADQLSRAVSATAFTTGSHIFFRSGAYQPQSSGGIRLLAHEATHTVQQAQGPVDGTPAAGGLSISDPSDRFERAASEAAARVSDGVAVQPTGMQRAVGAESALSIQRMPTSAEVKEQVGPRAAATGPQNQRMHYQEVLAALDCYQLIVTQNVATSPSERSRQVTDIRKALITVIDTCDRCLGVASSSAIAERCKGLKREAQQEEQLLGGRKNYFAQNPSAQKGTWKDALSDAASKYGVLAAGLAGELKRQAAAVEPGITDQIRTTVAQHGGQMYGLQHRLKEEESLARKIHEEAPGKGLTEEAYASRIKDAVRYTAHFSTATYTQGVESTMAALQSSGNRLYDLKNTWPLGNSYRGLNTWWQNPNGTIFEVQFHTPESQAVKDRNHKIYDVARLAQTTPQQRLAMEQEMITNANSIPTPPGAPSISRPISP